MSRQVSREQATDHLASMRTQKISFADYSNLSGIPIHTLRWWARREREQSEVSNTIESPAFLRVAQFPGAGLYQISVGDLRLEIPASFSDSDVSRLVRILRGV